MADDTRRRSDVAVADAKEKQRSRTGCRTCRSRKVKCDERPGGCRNCERLNLPCPNGGGAPVTAAAASAAAASPSDGKTQAGLRRSRTYRSCRACRNSKTRCSGAHPCARCTQRNVECLYEGKTAPAWMTGVSNSRNEPVSPSQSYDGMQPQSPTRTPATEGHRASHDEPMVDADVSSGEKSDPIQCPKQLQWLMSPHLPDKAMTMLLVEQFFACVHSLRCFGFIHKPSYMQELDERNSRGPENNPLLLVLCALGAKFHVMKAGLPIPDGLGFRVGNQWATRAQSILFTHLNNVSVTSTMAVVLLHEHELRVGNYASAFMLTGLAVRMAQALQINLEFSTNLTDATGELPWSLKESRRRLMWSIYIMDAWVGSGVDELTLVNEIDVKIQLPCNERSFMLEMPCIVETIDKGKYLPFLSAEILSRGPVDVLDLQAHFIRLLSFRRKVLRLVKHLDEATQPWLLDSEFMMLENSLLLWYSDLPSSLQFTRPAIYSRKEVSQLGALLLLHITYHQTLVDLYRIGMPDLFKIRTQFNIPASQDEFLKRVQDRCFDHAGGLAMILEEALKHGAETLADTWLSVVAHDSSRVVIHYFTQQLGTSRSKPVLIKTHAMSSLQANIEALKRMIPMYQLAKPLYMAASHMVLQAGIYLPDLNEGPASGRGYITQENEPASTLETPPQFSPEYVLNPLAIYRMARRGIQDHEKNAPERRSSVVLSSSPVSRRSDTGSSTHPYKPEAQPLPAQPPAAAQAPTVSPNQNNNAGFSSGGSQWFDDDINAGMGGFQLPTSLDNLQAYFPLMLNNFSLPAEASSFGGMGNPGGSVSGFVETNNSAQYSAGPIPYTPSMNDPAGRWHTYTGQI